MRALLLVISTVYILLPSPTHAEEAKTNCASPSNQIELNECVKEHYENSSRLMQELYDSKLLSLTKESRQRLSFAQEGWIIFRERTCIYQAQGIDGGSGWQMMYLSCMARMTEKRVAELQEYIACTANGCPE